MIVVGAVVGRLATGEIAREWEQLQRRIEIVGFAIREWDFLAPETAVVGPDVDEAFLRTSGLLA